MGATAANTTAGILDLTAVNATFAGALGANTNSVTATEIRIGTGRTLTINNNVRIGATSPIVTGTVTELDLTGGGSFNVTTPAAGSFNVGGSTSGSFSQAAALDLTALKATTINTSSTGTLMVGTNTSTNIGGQGRLLLPTPAVADTVPTATLTAGTIGFGVNGSLTGSTWQNRITLGTGLTTIQANTLNIGTGGRDLGQIIYGQSAGDLIIRAANGTDRATLINIGASGGVTAASGTTTLFDVSGHDADILVTSLHVGNQPRTASQSYEFRFGAGDGSLASKLDATHVNIGFRTGATTTTSTTTSRVNLSGGTVIFGNIEASGNGVDIGNSSYNQTGAASTRGELNISGGNVTIHNSASRVAAVRLGTNAATGNGTVTASLNLTGGTTTLGGDILRNVTSPRTTSTVRLSGGNLDMGGHDIGNLTEPITLSAESGTLQNAGLINGSGGLTKTTLGALTITGNNSYTGPTVVSTGTLALVGSLAGPVIVNGGTFAPQGLPASAGDFTLNADGTFQARINGSTAGEQYDEFTAGGTVTLAGPLDLVAGPGLAVGASFRILNKTSAGAVSGNFFGKPESSVFSEDGYPWIISYVGGDGNDVVLTLATPVQAWRFTHFGTIENSGAAADTSDANGDGEVNLLEFATGQNPHAASLIVLSAVRTASDLEFTYTRSKEALTGGVTFAVEWSDTLAPNSWFVTGVTQSILSDNGTLQTVKATVPTAAAIPRRFVRLNVTSP